MRILIGGSPCTKWSIAQKNNRETEPEGLGWELFENYLIAKEKFKPDYFLYENNKSAAQPIKDQISKELGVDLMYINSALVSAQNRQRFYAFNWEVDQPEDRGILLKDILETGVADRDKSRCVTASVGRTTHREYFMKQQNTMGIEPVGVGWRGRKGEDDKWHKVYESTGEEKANCLTTVPTDSMVAEPVNVTTDGKSQTIKAQYHKTSVANVCCYKSTYGATGVAEPVPCGQRQQDKSRTITAGYQTCSQRDLRMDIETDGFMGKQGVIEILPYYATAIEWDENGKPTKAVSGADGKVYTVYEVRDGIITIKDKQYPIKLPDGFYIIRKLTPVECERLQTLPDGYTRAVSDAQRYKGLGNGWTAEVIIHILNGILKDVPRDEEIVVLSMYDGIGTGRYCLDKMGFTNVKYYAYEIDKFAKQIAMSNYPDIIQCGDAFQVRDSEWHL
jgi:DNA (cytosine-5)-methyltransferase 3A